MIDVSLQHREMFFRTYNEARRAAAQRNLPRTAIYKKKVWMTHQGQVTVWCLNHIYVEKRRYCAIVGCDRVSVYETTGEFIDDYIP